MKKLTIGILAHVDAGKTTLSEALLYLCGAVRQLGRVDKRDTLLRSLNKARDKAVIILESRQQSLKQTQTMDIKRWCGELILEHIGEIITNQEILSLPFSSEEIPEEVSSALRLEAELAA